MQRNAAFCAASLAFCEAEAAQGVGDIVQNGRVLGAGWQFSRLAFGDLEHVDDDTVALAMPLAFSAPARWETRSSSFVQAMTCLVPATGLSWMMAGFLRRPAMTWQSTAFQQGGEYLYPRRS